MDDQTLTDAARAVAPAVHDIPAAFMLDGATYLAAAEAGYDGVAFYYAGRGGVLGDVEAAAVVDAFVFFPSGTVESAWASSAAVEGRGESAARFAACGSEWARTHLDEAGCDWARLADLAGKVAAGADAEGAPVFAGWRDLPEPSGERELALHRLNSLRELRAARHGRAVLDAGIEPLEALMVKTPYMADIFGWPEPRPEPDEALRARWEAAEERTNEAFGADLASLDDDELREFVQLCDAAVGAVG